MDTRARRVDSDPGPCQENYRQGCLRGVSSTLVPIQISGKEEIRISRGITRCKHKKVFLENIKMRVRVQKMLDPTGSNG
jgi:hypothetical protein